MSGNYFQPIKREFLNLSGGTVTGDTTFTLGLYGSTLSGGTIFSGNTNLEDIFLTASDVSGTTLSEGSNIVLQQAGINYNVSVVDSPSFDNVNFSGIGIGNIFSSNTISASTLYVDSTIEPIVDNYVDVGNQFKRFRSLNTVNGVAVNFTATTRVTTPEIVMGSTTITENNIVLSGYTLEGGSW